MVGWKDGGTVGWWDGGMIGRFSQQRLITPPHSDGALDAVSPPGLSNSSVSERCQPTCGFFSFNVGHFPQWRSSQ